MNEKKMIAKTIEQGAKIRILMDELRAREHRLLERVEFDQAELRRVRIALEAVQAFESGALVEVVLAAPVNYPGAAHTEAFVEVETVNGRSVRCTERTKDGLRRLGPFLNVPSAGEPEHR